MSPQANRFRSFLLLLDAGETEKLTGWASWQRTVDALHSFCDRERVPWARADEALRNLFARDADLASIRIDPSRVLMVVRAP